VTEHQPLEQIDHQREAQRCKRQRPTTSSGTGLTNTPLNTSVVTKPPAREGKPVADIGDKIVDLDPAQ